MTAQLRVQRGGEGDPVLLLLHGMGATGDVWGGLMPVLRERWPGRWVIPDLPGHGGSPPLSSYSFGHLAGPVARTVPAADRVVALGHSLGGVLALTLASGWFGVRLSAVCGLGIKVAWTEDELGRANALAARPNRVYATRAEAVERYLKVAGLTGLVAPDEVGDAAVVQTDEGWTTAFDPAAFSIGAPDMTGLIAAARGRVILAAGNRDPMCTADQLGRLLPDPVILPGLGHNAHVEDPGELASLLELLVA